MNHMQASFDNCQSEFKELEQNYVDLKFKITDIELDYGKKVSDINEQNKANGPSMA